MTPAVTSPSVAAKRDPQNILPPIPTNSRGFAVAQPAVPTLAVAATAAAWSSKESGIAFAAIAAVALFAKFLVCATFRLQKPRIKKQPYYYLQ